MQNDINFKGLNETINKLNNEICKYKTENDEIKIENTKLLTDVSSKKESIQLLQFKMLQIQEKSQVSLMLIYYF